MGEHEFKEKRKEIKADEEKEKDLEWRIQKLRKNLNKHRHDWAKDQNQPKRKKRKVEGGGNMWEEEMCEEERYLIKAREEEITKRQNDLVKKRRQEETKRKNKGGDIRQYFGQKKQKLDDEEYICQNIQDKQPHPETSISTKGSPEDCSTWDCPDKLLPQDPGH